MNRMALVLFCLVVFSATAGAATISPIDFNKFIADPTVSVSVNGNTAIISEKSFVTPVLLSNHPGRGDPQVIVAGGATSISFDFNFVEGAIGNDDQFGAFVLDSSGTSAGPGFEFFTKNTSSGTVAFLLAGLTGEPFIGLEFQLASLPTDAALDSVVTISNLRLKVIPIPTAAWMGLTMLAAMILLRRIRRRRHVV